MYNVILLKVIFSLRYFLRQSIKELKNEIVLYDDMITEATRIYLYTTVNNLCKLCTRKRKDIALY